VSSKIWALFPGGASRTSYNCGGAPASATAFGGRLRPGRDGHDLDCRQLAPSGDQTELTPAAAPLNRKTRSGNRRQRGGSWGTPLKNVRHPNQNIHRGFAPLGLLTLSIPPVSDGVLETNTSLKIASSQPAKKRNRDWCKFFKLYLDILRVPERPDVRRFRVLRDERISTWLQIHNEKTLSVWSNLPNQAPFRVVNGKLALIWLSRATFGSYHRARNDNHLANNARMTILREYKLRAKKQSEN
jgi:hypothetical protein